MLGRLIAKPSSVASLYEPLNAIDNLGDPQNHTFLPIERSILGTRSAASSSFKCYCPRRQVRLHSRRRFGVIEFYYEALTSDYHVPGCYFAGLGEKRTRTIGMTFNGLRRLLQRAVGVSFNINSGAGGFGMSPAVNYYAMVDRKHAPAFRIIQMLDTYCWSLFKYKNRSEFCGESQILIEHVIVLIRKLYLDRRASPTDIDVDGQSLMVFILYEVSNIQKQQQSFFSCFSLMLLLIDKVLDMPNL